jgi:glutamate synthase domain-containing protein 3
MTGGIAYVLDETGEFRSTRCNRAGVDLDPLDANDIPLVQGLIRRHHELTGSPRARRVLDEWDALLPRFVKVFPRELRRVLGNTAGAGREERQAAHG